MSEWNAGVYVCACSWAVLSRGWMKIQVFMESLFWLVLTALLLVIDDKLVSCFSFVWVVYSVQTVLCFCCKGWLHCGQMVSVWVIAAPCYCITLLLHSAVWMWQFCLNSLQYLGRHLRSQCVCVCVCICMCLHVCLKTRQWGDVFEFTRSPTVPGLLLSPQMQCVSGGYTYKGVCVCFCVCSCPLTQVKRSTQTEF